MPLIPSMFSTKESLPNFGGRFRIITSSPPGEPEPLEEPRDGVGVRGQRLEDDGGEDGVGGHHEARRVQGVGVAHLMEEM